MSASNPRWGAERLRGELLKLGIHISKRTVQKYMTRRAPDGGPASVLVPMSEFLHLGLPLEQVIAGVTATPGKMLNYPEKVGTLQAGATADVAILELAQGSFEYRDGGRQPRTLKQQFVPVATVKGGIFLKGAPGAAQLTR